MWRRRKLGRAAWLAVGAVSAAAGADAQSSSEAPLWGSVMRQSREVALEAPSLRDGARNVATPRAGAADGVTGAERHQSGRVGAFAATPSPPQVSGAAPAPQPLALQALIAGRRVVPFAAAYPPGAIVISNRERALYHVGQDRTAIRYPVAIGSFTEEWIGVEFITDKKINPTWHPVPEPGKEPREPVPGGDPANPLGARALYLGRTLWRIHGTPAKESIGQAVSAGCIRMHNEHIIELYENVLLGTEVYVVNRLNDPAPAHRGRKIIEPVSAIAVP